MLLARSYSHHSLLSAVPKIDKLLELAKKKGYTSVALTDENTGSGLIEFYLSAKKFGIKPVLGVNLKIPNLTQIGSGFGGNTKFSKLSLLAKNQTGYQSMLSLISIARTQREKPAYHLTLADLAEQTAKKGIFVCLNGNDHELGSLARNARQDDIQEVLGKYIECLGVQNLLVELAYPLDKENPSDLQKTNQILIDSCDCLGVRYIASPAPRYLDPQDRETFKIVLAIRDAKRVKDISLERGFHMPSLEDLKKIYSYAPKALQTEDLEAQFDLSLNTDYDKNATQAFFPVYHLPKDQATEKRLSWEAYINFLVKFSEEDQSKDFWIQKFAYKDLEELKAFAKTLKPWLKPNSKYSQDYWKDPQKKLHSYVARIEKELDIITQKGYPSYFLVFSDIMEFCRRNQIVITTRGSAAGSLVGYLLNINILDPLVYNLPFERFLNPMRPSAPDIDGDFADDRREEVIEYIKKTYGEDKVTQIITFGTMLPRAAVRDVGRALGIPYKKCDRLSKLIPIAPQGRKTTFDWAMETSEELRTAYQKDAEVKQIIDISKKIEGNYRHASSHAAGIIVSPTKFTDYAPLQWDSEHKMLVCQYDMKIAEKIGLIKFDILGIRNLAILGNAVGLAQKRRRKKIDLLEIDLQDKKAFQMLSTGRTMGIFQLSGAGMTRFLVDLEPERVEDLMAMVALYRPGPMANIPEYIKRKKDPKKVKYYVPQMEEWMKSSYGILVYQDDLLYTVINLAGYDWLEADTFRKGVGKKIQAVLNAQHLRFVEGCKQHTNLSQEKAESLWELMVPFAAYGFNKAHASSYGMVSYWTAYMKARYTAEFMTAYMTAENSNLDKISEAIQECRTMGIEVAPPDVNKSYANFHIEDDKTIRYGLNSVKNLGSDVIEYLIKEREAGGKFEDISDFLKRMSSLRNFNKKNVEALIWSGCLDILGRLELEQVDLA